MTDNIDADAWTDDSEPYRVECDQCDEVVFDDIDVPNQFALALQAAWYAGYHSGKEHPDSDYQEALPKKEGDELSDDPPASLDDV